MKLLGNFSNQETPRQSPEQHQFGPPRDPKEQRRQHIAAQHQGHRHQCDDAPDRQQHDRDLQIVQARLHGKEQNREDVLQHEDAEGDAARQRIELTLLIQHLDDDDGAAQCAGDAQIERIEAALPHRQSDRHEERDAKQAAADQLSARPEQDHPAGTDDLLQIDFQPDHEQHEDQAELGNGVDRVPRLHPPHAVGANDETGHQIGENQRLTQEMRGQAKPPRKQNAERNIANQFGHASPGSAGA